MAPQAAAPSFRHAVLHPSVNERDVAVLKRRLAGPVAGRAIVVNDRRDLFVERDRGKVRRAQRRDCQCARGKGGERRVLRFESSNSIVRAASASPLSGLVTFCKALPVRAGRSGQPRFKWRSCTRRTSFQRPNPTIRPTPDFARRGPSPTSQLHRAAIVLCSR